MAYVFYDVETSGLDPRFDQILQFAAIHTDEFLVERERINVRCRLRPQNIPSVEALAINGVLVANCFDRSLRSHYEMIADVHAQLTAWSPSLFIGWNSIRFDEEFLRHAFYSCLHNAYLTNWHGNARLDLMYLTGAAFVYEPKCVSKAFREDGIETLALEALAAANGFKGARAHDAMTDVEATLHLAKLLKAGAPQVWSQGVRFAQKKAALDFLNSNEPVVVTEIFKGRRDQYAVAKIGADPEIDSYVYAADLERDYSEFLALPTEERIGWISSTPMPIRKIRSNASPMLMPLEELDEFNGRAANDYYEKADALQQDGALCRALCKSFMEATAREYSNEYVEQQLYENLTSKETLAAFERFHQKPWRERKAVIASLSDKRYQRLGLRLIYEHAPETLTEKETASAQKWLQSVVHGKVNKDVPWRTIETAHSEIENLREDPRFAANVALFEEYEAYLQRLEPIR